MFIDFCLKSNDMNRKTIYKCNAANWEKVKMNFEGLLGSHSINTIMPCVQWPYCVKSFRAKHPLENLHFESNGFKLTIFPL